MRRRTLALGMTLAAGFLLAGCGSSSSTSNPFAGTWGGRWRDDISQYGNLRLVVASDGAVSGTVTNLVVNPGVVTTGTVGGTVSTTGAANLTYTFTTSRATTVYTAIGTMTKGTNGLVTGSLSESTPVLTNFATASVTFWTPSSYPFTGTWTGTWTDTAGQNGALNLTADENGAVSGTQTNVKPTGTLTGNVAGVLNYDGAINLYYLYPSVGTFTGAGTVALTGNTASGSVTTYNGATQLATATVNVTK